MEDSPKAVDSDISLQDTTRLRTGVQRSDQGLAEKVE